MPTIRRLMTTDRIAWQRNKARRRPRTVRANLLGASMALPPHEDRGLHLGGRPRGPRVPAARGLWHAGLHDHVEPVRGVAVWGCSRLRRGPALTLEVRARVALRARRERAELGRRGARSVVLLARGPAARLASWRWATAILALIESRLIAVSSAIASPRRIGFEPEVARQPPPNKVGAPLRRFGWLLRPDRSELRQQPPWLARSRRVTGVSLAEPWVAAGLER